MTSSSSNSAIEIYPNPVAQRIYINSDAPIEDAVLEIYDMDGRLIYRYDHFNAESFDVSALKNGLYLLKIQCSDYSYQTRFSVIH